MALVNGSITGRIGTVTFNHDTKRNALSAGLIAETIAMLDAFKAQQARVVILRTATAGKVWSAGHDIRELPAADLDPLPYSGPLEQLLRAVKAYPAPVIAMVQGSVWGGACDLVVACDLIYGDETASFAVTPAKIGVPYNVSGLLNFMSRLPLNVIKEMFFSAEPISAQRAEKIGLVNDIFPAMDLEEKVYAMAQTLCRRSSAAIAAAKESIRVLSESTPLNPITFEYLQGLRRDVYLGPDYREGILAYREKRSPDF